MLLEVRTSIKKKIKNKKKEEELPLKKNKK